MGKYQTRVEKDIAFVFMFCGGSVGYFLFRLTIKEDTLLSTQSGNKVPITFLILSSVFTKRIMTAKLEMKIVSEITVLSQ